LDLLERRRGVYLEHFCISIGPCWAFLFLYRLLCLGFYKEGCGRGGEDDGGHNDAGDAANAGWTAWIEGCGGSGCGASLLRREGGQDLCFVF
jgi:hypothetical protein